VYTSAFLENDYMKESVNLIIETLCWLH